MVICTFKETLADSRLLVRCSSKRENEARGHIFDMTSPEWMPEIEFKKRRVNSKLNFLKEDT